MTMGVFSSREITFFAWLHLTILVHPVFSDVDQHFAFEVSHADISHFTNLKQQTQDFLKCILYLYFSRLNI